MYNTTCAESEWSLPICQDKFGGNNTPCVHQPLSCGTIPSNPAEARWGERAVVSAEVVISEWFRHRGPAFRIPSWWEVAVKLLKVGSWVSIIVPIPCRSHGISRLTLLLQLFVVVWCKFGGWIEIIILRPVVPPCIFGSQDVSQKLVFTLTNQPPDAGCKMMSFAVACIIVGIQSANLGNAVNWM
jgi:hypothetical protein